MRKLYSEMADACVLVFSVSDPLSFDHALDIYDDLKGRNRKNAPVMLLATKTDLYRDESEWSVSPAKISQFIQQSKCPYTSLSVKDTQLVLMNFLINTGHIFKEK